MQAYVRALLQLVLVILMILVMLGIASTCQVTAASVACDVTEGWLRGERSETGKTKKMHVCM